MFVYFGINRLRLEICPYPYHRLQASGPQQVLSLEILSKHKGSLVCPCNEKYDSAPLMICLPLPQVFSKSGSPIHSEFFLPSTFVLQHQGATSTPLLPSPSAFSRSSLCLRVWGEIEDRKYSLITLKKFLLRRYIIAQTLGAYIACLFVYNQWKVLIDESQVLLMAAGPAEFAATQFTPNGLPGIFVPYMLPEQTLSRVFMNEFVNVGLCVVNNYQELPFSSKYFVWTIVYHHRSDHLGSIGPNKLLHPTDYVTNRHRFCIVSRNSNHLEGISHRYRQWHHHLGLWCSRRWGSSSSPHQTVATHT